MRSAALILAVLACGTAFARDPRPPSDTARTAAYLNRIADSPPRLRMFLKMMPKGADLHNHGGGSIYAEDWLRFAAAGGLCIATDTDSIVPPPCDAPGRVPAKGLETNYPLYSRMLDALSTRGFESGVNDPRRSGYDRFFATFDAFGTASLGNEAKEFALTREQAAADHVSYVEFGVGAHQARGLAAAVKDLDPTDFAALAAALAPLLPDAVARACADYDRYEAESAKIDGCGTVAAKPACGVEMRYLYTAMRTIPPAQTFAQLAFGFALAQADPRFVGVNIAAPEHDPVAVRAYDLHMRMLAWLKAKHPQVPLSLHAGELTLGLVPPRDLASHIREAVEVAGAKRIGHGVDISYEDDAAGLLREMATKQIDVEINLTSNAVILGVKGKAHPLSLYREAAVPVTLSTDDEGVSRSDMTNEYVRAVVEQGLRYADLKQIVRDSVHYSFLPGASLWRGRAGGAKAACATEGAACTAFLAASPKAEKEHQIERDLAAFEAKAGSLAVDPR